MIPGLERLPLEITSQILQYFHFKELINITLVCKEWHNFIWRNFTILRLAQFRVTTVNELNLIISKLERVQELELHRIADETTLHLIASSFPYLKHLSIRRNQNISNLSLLSLRHFSHLQSIHLSGSWNITAEGIKNIGYHSTLTTIEMRGCDCIENEALVYISKQFPNLKILDLRDCDKIDDAGMEMICENIGGLTYIDVSGSKITDLTLKRIAACYPNSLHTLHLWTCQHITDEGIYALMKINTLEVLNVQDGKLFTDASFRFLASFPAIRHLLIGSPLLTDKACVNFSSATLKEISVFLQEDYLTEQTRKSQLQDIPIVHWGYFVMVE